MPPRKAPASPARSTSTSTAPSPAKPALTGKPPRNTKVSADKITKSSTKPSTATAKPKPATEKKEKLTDAQATDTVLAYLDAQNRPYSAGDVSSNLHNVVSRMKVDKILREASEKGRVVGKCAGKMWVFHGVQDPNDTCTPEELDAIETRITSAREKVAELKSGLRGKNGELARVKSELGTAEIKAHVATLEVRKLELGKRLDVLRSGGVKLVSREERERVGVEHARWAREKAVWKKGFTELEAVFLEGIGREELWEKAGVEAVED